MKKRKRERKERKEAEREGGRREEGSKGGSEEGRKEGRKERRSSHGDKMYQKTGRSYVYLGSFIKSLCGFGQVTLPL
jgi:hypothetical protein